MDYNIIFEVHCERPDWAMSENLPASKTKYKDTKYRIFVDNDLITERTWIWNNNICLIENMWITSDDPAHTVRLEPVVKIAEQAAFTIKNFKVNDQLYNVNNTLEINFNHINTL